MHRLREDYSMNYFNSKRFWNKNTNPRTVFGIMVSRSLDVSLHFNENLNISDFLYILWNFQNFVHRLRKDYSMNYFNSKRFWNKNTNPRTVFGIMVSRSLDISLHFNEILNISVFYFLFSKFPQNLSESAVWACLNIFFQKYFKSYLWLCSILVFSWCFEAF